jgi:cysteine-rich repeat protein
VGQACLDWSKLQNGACGDGFVGREEACDDGNRISGDGCSDTCLIEPPYCGNGRLDPGEDCDDANDLDDACVAGCKVARCGDGLLWELDEGCDDGNHSAGDGCSPDCQIETMPPGPRCGDGTLDADEACDDGNESDADRCLHGCSWATCGDGRLRGNVEECDDTKPNSGCTKGCLRCAGDATLYFRGGNAHCYTRHDEALPEAEAREVCQAEGGDLWTATSQAESSDVTATLALSGRLWLGLHTVVGGMRSWVTGEDISFTAFAQGEPSDKALHCVALEPAGVGSWSSEACDSQLSFVCERAPAFVATGSDHHAYRVHSGAVTQAVARQRCAEEGGKLCALETDEERLFVGKQVHVVAWLDATEASEGRFVWPSGAAVDDIWGPSQPDDVDGSQACLAFNPGDRYADGSCSDQHAYVCEFE